MSDGYHGSASFRVVPVFWRRYDGIPSGFVYNIAVFLKKSAKMFPFDLFFVHTWWQGLGLIPDIEKTALSFLGYSADDLKSEVGKVPEL